jgi:hypothetical protein
VVILMGGDSAWSRISRNRAVPATAADGVNPDLAGPRRLTVAAGPDPGGAPTDPDRIPHGHVDLGGDRERFRRAATALLDDGPDSENARQFSTEAAAALVAAAEAGDPGLGQILRPDPDDTGPVTWTVACYQIGDLSPTTLTDFADANEAVRSVAHCPEIAHVAAELLASTASGLRWTVLVRTGDLLSFQLFTAGGGGHDLSGALQEAAERRWVAQLPRWAAEALASPPAPDWTRRQAVPALPPEFGVAMGQILEAVQGLTRRVEDLVTAREVMDRLNALEQRLVEVQLQLGVHALASSPGPHRSHFEPIDAQASTGRLLPADRRGRPDDPASPLGKRVADVLSRAASRGLAAARHYQQSAPPTGWRGDARDSG